MATSDGILDLPSAERERLWARLAAAVERYAATVGSLPVAPRVDVPALREEIAAHDFSRPVAPVEALDWVVARLTAGQVHTPHPRYYGLFNPRPTTLGIAADALVAAFNPQLAAWEHSPFANEVERHLVRLFGERFGYDRDSTEGSFTSGGAEANHTALLAALVHAFPAYRTSGARALAAQPVLYTSTESHHSFLKAASLCGIGSDAVATVAVDRAYRMDPEALASQVSRDRAEGRQPFLVVATLGTTNAGLIDPIGEIAEVAAGEGLWLHADAAWGGAAMLVPELRRQLAGIERADSITFDAHKWLSVPMGAGMILTRHRGILDATFATRTDYMPPASAADVVEPHQTSMQWSRRFIGLKLLMSLLVAGWEGYEEVLRAQVALADELRERLAGAGWRVVNETRLPTVCWEDATHSPCDPAAYLREIAAAIVGSGRHWISVTRLGGTRPVLRATITNYATRSTDLVALVADLERARERARDSPARPGR